MLRGVDGARSAPGGQKRIDRGEVPGVPRALAPVLLALLAGCGSAASPAPIAHGAPPVPQPDWRVRACGEVQPWDGAEAFAPGTRVDGAPFVAAPLITDRPLEIALLRDLAAPTGVRLSLLLLRCQDRRWVEQAKVDLGIGDRAVHRRERRLQVEPLAFGDRMATLIRVSEPGTSSAGAEWVVLISGDGTSARAVVAQPVSGAPLAFLVPHRGGVALATVRERNGRIEGRVLAAIDPQGRDAAAPDALWAARVRARPQLCVRDDLRCYPVCGAIHLVAGWPRAEDVPLDALGIAPTLVWLGRGAPPEAPAPLATVSPGLAAGGDPACVF